MAASKLRDSENRSPSSDRVPHSTKSSCLSSMSQGTRHASPARRTACALRSRNGRSAGSSSNAVIENERRPSPRARMRAANAAKSVPAPAPGSNTLTDRPFVSHIAAISRATHIGVKYWPRAIWRSATREALAALRITAPSARRRSAIADRSRGIGGREVRSFAAATLRLFARADEIVRTPRSGVRTRSVNGVVMPSGMGGGVGEGRDVGFRKLTYSGFVRKRPVGHEAGRPRVAVPTIRRYS